MAVRFRLREQLEDVKPAMSQAELARLSRISANTINAIANNNTKQVSLATLDALCRALRCTPGDLLEYVRDAPQPANLRRLSRALQGEFTPVRRRRDKEK